MAEKRKKEAEHGASRYRSRSNPCRCDVCRRDHSRRHRQEDLRRRAARLPGNIAPNVEHGLASTYKNHSCRCEACSEAHSAVCRRYRESQPGWKPRPVPELEVRVARLEPRLDTTQTTRRAPDPNRRVPDTPERELPRWTGEWEQE
jgi:hypothetical protein